MQGWQRVKLCGWGGTSSLSPHEAGAAGAHPENTAPSSHFLKFLCGL